MDISVTALRDSKDQLVKVYNTMQYCRCNRSRKSEISGILDWYRTLIAYSNRQCIEMPRCKKRKKMKKGKKKANKKRNLIETDSKTNKFH